MKYIFTLFVLLLLTMQTSFAWSGFAAFEPKVTSASSESIRDGWTGFSVFSSAQPTMQLAYKNNALICTQQSAHKYYYRTIEFEQCEDEKDFIIQSRNFFLEEYRECEEEDDQYEPWCKENKAQFEYYDSLLHP